MSIEKSVSEKQEKEQPVNGYRKSPLVVTINGGDKEDDPVPEELTLESAEYLEKEKKND